MCHVYGTLTTQTGYSRYITVQCNMPNRRARLHTDALEQPVAPHRARVFHYYTIQPSRTMGYLLLTLDFDRTAVCALVLILIQLIVLLYSY